MPNFLTTPTVNGVNVATVTDANKYIEFSHFYRGGTLAVENGVGRDIVGEAGTVQEVAAVVNVAPGTTGIIVGIALNGVEFTTATIAVASNHVFVTGLTQSVIRGDHITANIKQIGAAGAEGSDLTVKVKIAH